VSQIVREPDKSRKTASFSNLAARAPLSLGTVAGEFYQRLSPFANYGWRAG
jgi:hypothetical protein